VADARAFQSNLANREENETIYLSEILAERLYQIPEILGKEIVTLEFLESQDIRNLTALNEAIADAENPEKK
jgi:hypothetical protein